MSRLAMNNYREIASKSIALILTVVAISTAPESHSAYYSEAENKSCDVNKPENLAMTNEETLPPLANPKDDRGFFNRAESGIYRNPMAENDFLTVHFRNDPGAIERIEEDVRKYRIDKNDYKRQLEKLTGMLKAGEAAGVRLSAHVVMPKAQNKFDDMNIITLDLYRESKVGRYGLSRFYSNYTTFIHEAAHALVFQEITESKLAWLSSSDYLENTLFRENASDYIAAIKLIQLMVKDGAAKIDILKVLDKWIDIRKKLAFDSKAQSLTYSDHYTALSVLTAKRLFKNQPDYIKSLSDAQIIKDAEIVSSSLLDEDFTKVVSLSLKETPELVNNKIITTLADKAETSNAVSSYGSITNPLVQYLLSDIAFTSASRFSYEMEQQLTTAEPKQYTVVFGSN